MKIFAETDYKAFEEALGPLWAVQNALHDVDNTKETWAFTARDTNGRVVGGIGGYLRWNWLYVQHLIVAPEMRGKGLGVALMREAEDFARGKGAAGLHLTTLGFQAPAFYTKCGFEVAGEIEGMPPGSRFMVMAKRLA